MGRQRHSIAQFLWDVDDGIIWLYWLWSQRIRPKSTQLSALQRLTHRILIYQLPTGGVDKNGPILHFFDSLAVYDIDTVWSDRQMQTDDIAGGKQLVQLGIDHLPGIRFR